MHTCPKGDESWEEGERGQDRVLRGESKGAPVCQAWDHSYEQDKCGLHCHDTFQGKET